MILFSDFITERVGSHTSVEQDVQNKLFGSNDYIPFEHNSVHESIEEHPDNNKRLVVKGESHQTTASGLIVPRHMWEGGRTAVGMKERNKKRAEIYGSENRPPLSRNQIHALHKSVLEDHFKKPESEQLSAEKEAIARLQAAGHLDSGKTTDTGEKTDTVNFEKDEKGRQYTALASKGVAGHALYTSGTGDHEIHHVINTCLGQTKGCGGGVDAKGVADTSKGTCFAPKSEQQYPNAAIRRATHEQAKHDPKMSGDWILAHTHSLRNAADSADNNNKRLLFRPNVVDETDTTSRHVIKGLNNQREAKGKPSIIGNSYGKTGELHDPANSWHVTYSNTGPKVKKGEVISENVRRDTKRQAETIHASNASGDVRNDEGKKTPPKGSYLITNVRRDSPLDAEYQKHITHAKYWSKGKPISELSDNEKLQGAEGDFDGKGKPTTKEAAHYGHTTINGHRYDYQKQHILHPRIVHFPIKGKNGDITYHSIPTDSRFMDDKFLPKRSERFKSKNGKTVGGILVSTPTNSTSNIQLDSAFTHHVDKKTIEHAKRHGGEHEIDRPEDQEAARGKEYMAANPITFKKKSDIK